MGTVGNVRSQPPPADAQRQWLDHLTIGTDWRDSAIVTVK
jgi:hypothetical protein